MNRAIAMLRGVNVGKGKPVAMAELQRMMAELGFAGAQTLLRSGNLVFDPGGEAPPELEALLEREAEARLGLKTQIFVRTAAEWSQALAHNPFGEEAGRDPAHLLVVAFRQAPSAEAMAGLSAAIPGRERIAAWDRHAYVVYPDGIADSSLTPKLWAKWLPPGTGRNWNTALKLATMVEAAPR
jgi:uncharacterized protein (DUF1697 family)